MTTKVGKQAPYLAGIPVVSSSAERDSLFGAPDTHQRVHRTDTGTVERYTGSAWVTELGPGSPGTYATVATATARDAAFPTPTANQRVYRTDTQQLERYTGTAWTVEVERPSEWLNPKAYGALGDGSGTVITSADVTANALLPTSDRWLGTYTAGVTTWDRVGMQEAIYRAWAGVASTPGSIVWNSTANQTHNKGVRVTAGDYVLDDALVAQDVIGTQFVGAGRSATYVRIRKKYTPAFSANGWARNVMHGIFWSGEDTSGGGSPARSRNFWWPNRAYALGDRIYSTNTSTSGNTLPADIFECTTAGTSGGSAPTWSAVDGSNHLTDNTVTWTWKPTTPVVLLDYDGSGFSGTNQANTISDCDFQTSNATTHSVGLQIGTGLQSQGSEYIIANCHAFWPPIGLRTMDYDSYAIQVLGGNYATNRMHGINIVRGSVYVRGTGFQNGTATTLSEDGIQYGWDVFCEQSADTVSRVTSIRSESAKIAGTGNSHMLVVEGFEHIPNGVSNYADFGPSRALTAGTLACSTSAVSDGAVWEVTTAGTTGGSEPNWAGAGGSPIVDGSVTWTQRSPSVFYGDALFVSKGTMRYGRAVVQAADEAPSSFSDMVVSRPDWLHNNVGVFSRKTMLRVRNVFVKLGGGMNTGDITPSEYALAGSSTMPTTRSPESLGNSLLLWHNHLGGLGLGLVDHRDILDADLANAERAFLALVAWAGQATGFTVQPPQTNNTAGNALRLWGGPSRGNGTPGALEFYTSQVGSSGAQVNPKVLAGKFDELQRLILSAAVARKVFALTDGAAPAVDASKGNYATLVSTTSPTIAAPTNAVSGMQLTFEITRNQAGAWALTWNAIYKLAGAWVDPANTKIRKITFTYNGTSWVEDARTTSDI